MTISEFTVQSARKYLRTVLLVDDQLFPPDPAVTSELQSADLPAAQSIPDTATQEGLPKDVGNQSPDLPAKNGLPSSEPTDDQTSNDEFFSPKDVVEGFAKQGIVCGLYQPKTSDFPSGNVPRKVVDLCDHADVFILDWKLKDGKLRSPVPNLLAQLLRHDESVGTPKPIRFCAIYTDRPLNTVVLDINNDIIRVFNPESVVQDDSIRRFQLRGLTIRLYSKNMQIEPHSTESCFVSSSDLAERVIHDFASEYEGVMSATALRGIAEVRSNAKRILDKFHPALDYAFAIHSGLTISDPTVPEDLSGLLSDEISAIIQEIVPDENLVHELLAAKIDRLSDSCFSRIAADARLVVPETTASAVKRYFVDLFRSHAEPSPFVASEVDCTNHIIGRRMLEKLQSLALSVADTQNYAEGDLSKLFCQRTVYGNRRVLKSGTIVRESGSGSYYLCLMPLCDSVRLRRTKVLFPFWKLTQILAVEEVTGSVSGSDGHSSLGNGQSHGLIVSEQDGTPKRLCLKGKIKDKMSFLQFKADDVVQFAKEGSSFFITECPRGNVSVSSQQQNQTATTAYTPKKFEWVAELKPLHAQRMAEYVSRQFSRVGVAESEWLRLQVDR